MQKHAGKLIIITIFLVGFGSAGFSIWFRHSQTMRVLGYYGGAAAELITGRETKATLYLLGPLDEQPLEETRTATLRTKEQAIQLTIEAERDVTKTGGFHNARNAITIDRSYDWTDQQPPEALTWRFALKIEEEEQVATLIFSADCEYVMLAEFGIDKTPPPLPSDACPAYGHAVRATAMGEGIDKLFEAQFVVLQPVE